MLLWSLPTLFSEELSYRSASFQFWGIGQTSAWPIKDVIVRIQLSRAKSICHLCIGPDEWLIFKRLQTYTLTLLSSWNVRQVALDSSNFVWQLVFLFCFIRDNNRMRQRRRKKQSWPRQLQFGADVCRSSWFPLKRARSIQKIISRAELYAGPWLPSPREQLIMIRQTLKLTGNQLPKSASVYCTGVSYCLKYFACIDIFHPKI